MGFIYDRKMRSSEMLSQEELIAMGLEDSGVIVIYDYEGTV
jgi:hypothetical protein